MDATAHKENLDLVAMRIERSIDYYRENSFNFKWYTRFLLAASGAAFVYGVVAPLLAHLDTSEQKIHLTYGLIALALAGILLSADRWFLISRNWRQYTATCLLLEDLRNTFEIERRAFETQREGHEDLSLRIDRTDEVRDFCLRFERERQKIVKDETELWMKDLDAAIADMQAKVEERRAAVAGIIDAQRARGAEPPKPAGAVELLIAGRARPGVTHRLTVGGAQAEERDAHHESIVKTDVAPGLVGIRYEAILDQAVGFSAERASVVKSGEVSTLRVTLPRNLVV